MLLTIARHPTPRLQEVAAVCHLPERTAQRITAHLEHAGYLTRQRVGRRTQYTVNRDRPLRHPAATGPTVSDLLRLSAGRAHQDTDTQAAP
jgi:hypothetical protein